VLFLIGFRNRILVLIEWAWQYVTFKRGSRLITGPPVAHADAHTAVGIPPVRADQTSTISRAN